MTVCGLLLINSIAIAYTLRYFKKKNSNFYDLFKTHMFNQNEDENVKLEITVDKNEEEKKDNEDLESLECSKIPGSSFIMVGKSLLKSNCKDT